MPNVSIIIPSYNCSSFIGKTIESVLKQTYDDYEIIIIDDGSTDNTKEIIDAYTKKFPYKIKYIYQENKGQAIARNIGILNSNGRFIAFLDSDDIWSHERLKDGVRLLENNMNIGLVHSDVICIDENGTIINQPQLDRKQKERKIKFLSGRIFKYLLIRKAQICSSSVVIKRECINAIGLFDKQLSQLGCEDRDLWLRISEKYDIGYIDKPLVYYRYRKDSASRNINNMLRGRYYILEKFFLNRKISYKLKNQACSSIHKELAYHYLIKNKFNNAINECCKAIAYYPMDIVPYKIFIKIYFNWFFKSMSGV